MIQKKEKKIEKIKRIFHSVKAKLFITLCATVLCIIIFLIILNSFALLLYPFLFICQEVLLFHSLEGTDENKKNRL